MDPPLFWASADAGSIAAITTHKTKRMTYLRYRSDTNAQGRVRMQRPGAESSVGKGRECQYDVFAGAYECTHRRTKSPTCSRAWRPSVSFAFHIGQAWIMCGHTCNVTLTSASAAARAKRTE